MRKWVVFCIMGFVLAVASVLATGAFVWKKNRDYLESELMLISPEIYAVNPGHNLTNILRSWQRLGYVELMPPLFLYQISQEKGSSKVLIGHYQLRPGMTVNQSIEMLLTGKALEYRWQIIEGSRLDVLLTKMHDNNNIQYDLPPVKSRSDYLRLSQFLGLDKKNPEGLFFADTYNFLGGSKASDLLKKSAKRLNEVLEDEWQQRAENLPYKSAYEALIMASIVEKETGRADERPRIAGVFTKRLKRGMRLQTDPTVIYGLGDNYKGNVTRKHLRTPTAYNTYTISGLPPTPIASVGREAIHASLHPLEDGSLYFVARGDGSHAFSKTFAEHKRAVARYQLRRSKNYRSSPE